MKIKQKRQVNLPQLIEWCWGNDKNGVYRSLNDKKVLVNIQSNKVATFYGSLFPSKKSLFEIEEEVEIDENTKLELVAETSLGKFGGKYVFARENESVRTIVSESIKCGGTIFTLHYVNPDGTMILLWKDGEMVE